MHFINHQTYFLLLWHTLLYIQLKLFYIILSRIIKSYKLTGEVVLSYSQNFRNWVRLESCQGEIHVYLNKEGIVFEERNHMKLIIYLKMYLHATFQIEVSTLKPVLFYGHMKSNLQYFTWEIWSYIIWQLRNATV